jgi:hypothetical protein
MLSLLKENTPLNSLRGGETVTGVLKCFSKEFYHLPEITSKLS